VFATGPGGKPIPLRKIRRVYALSGDGHAEVVLAGSDSYISHFEDCPAASTFSKKKEPA